ncbi:hypothetical protein LCGC14_1955580 [marine sediment metagenome]|mgnify:FL=1|uniref:Chemotaxis methyl-accepting receptor HlyB-like 4HB MCP domain-containing protein n=1 Tax=marine sediment metagenome TaxID=412755 RepID=A0A0F9FG52_9ZZZZ|tara:strand:- start:191 stop:790 length:600 start_codon:yes stop_codon:yes gene_type:complete
MEIKGFLKDYGIFVSIGSSILLVMLGWYVVYNGSKYIATRSEGRAIFLTFLEKLSSIVDERIKFITNTANFGSSSLVNYTAKQNVIAVERLLNYQSVLLRYGISNFFKEDDFLNLKFLLTYAPAKEDYNDNFVKFNSSIIENLHKVSAAIETQAHESYLDTHKPTVTPFIKKLSPSILGFIFAIVILFTFSFFIRSFSS